MTNQTTTTTTTTFGNTTTAILANVTANKALQNILYETLLNNSRYTDGKHFVSSKNVTPTYYKVWSENVLAFSSCAWEHYQAKKNMLDSDTQKKLFDNCFTALKNIISLIGNTVPTSDGKGQVKITCDFKENNDDTTLFQTAYELSINHFAKVEKKVLELAREGKKKAQQEYKKNCFTENGTVKAGLTEEYIRSFTSKIEQYDDDITKMLAKADYSIYDDTQKKDKKFLREFEIVFRNVIRNAHKMTVEQAKAKDKAKDEQRKANRNK